VSQTFPAKNIIPIVAFEKRAGEEINKPRESLLRKKFEGKFAQLMFTYHPSDIPGELIGKSSNAAWAGKQLSRELKSHPRWRVEKMTITSIDSDVKIHPNYFAALTFNFLDNPARYRRIWQGSVMFYNNIDKVPWPMRVFNRVASVYYMALLMRPDRLINFSTYSLSLKLMEEIGYTGGL